MNNSQGNNMKYYFLAGFLLTTVAIGIHSYEKKLEALEKRIEVKADKPVQKQIDVHQMLKDNNDFIIGQYSR
jgi:hypothetical protein